MGRPKGSKNKIVKIVDGATYNSDQEVLTDQVVEQGSETASNNSVKVELKKQKKPLSLDAIKSEYDRKLRELTSKKEKLDAWLAKVIVKTIKQ